MRNRFKAVMSIIPRRAGEGARWKRATQSSLRSHQRQRDRDPQPTERRSPGRDRPLMRFDDILADCETQPGAAARPVARTFDTIEALEQTRQRSGWYRRLGVLKVDLHFALAKPTRDFDHSARIGVAQRVLEEIV